MPRALHYSDFEDRINIDALEAAVGFTPEYERGDNDVGYCIWPERHMHGDTTGKFAIHREKRVYNCYVCGGGDFLSLAMEFLDTGDVSQATSWLYQFAGEDHRTDDEFVHEMLELVADVEERQSKLPWFNERVLDQFNEELASAYVFKQGEWINWFDDRHILSDDAFEFYGLRYSVDLRRGSPKGGKFEGEPDYVGPGLIFPHYWMDRLVGWQTRWLAYGSDDFPDFIPKYTNTSDFPKQNTVYGWDMLQRILAEGYEGPVYAVESVPSAIYLTSHGYPAVATFGSNVNDAQLRVMRSYGWWCLWADNDKGGREWSGKVSRYLDRYCKVEVVTPVEGDKSDPGDVKPQDLHELTARTSTPGLNL